jgi:hypothetical protein
MATTPLRGLGIVGLLLAALAGSAAAQATGPDGWAPPALHELPHGDRLPAPGRSTPPPRTAGGARRPGPWRADTALRSLPPGHQLRRRSCARCPALGAGAAVDGLGGPGRCPALRRTDRPRQKPRSRLRGPAAAHGRGRPRAMGLGARCRARGASGFTAGLPRGRAALGGCRGALPGLTSRPGTPGRSVVDPGRSRTFASRTGDLHFELGSKLSTYRCPGRTPATLRVIVNKVRPS